MKANEPKKIYLHIRPNKEIGSTWHGNKISDTDIEYTRTDAFIEKAQLFLIDKLNEIPMGSGKMKIKAECSLDEFIENFRKYMEGE